MSLVECVPQFHVQYRLWSSAAVVRVALLVSVLLLAVTVSALPPPPPPSPATAWAGCSTFGGNSLTQFPDEPPLYVLPCHNFWLSLLVKHPPAVAYSVSLAIKEDVNSVARLVKEEHTDWSWASGVGGQIVCSQALLAPVCLSMNGKSSCSNNGGHKWVTALHCAGPGSVLLEMILYSEQSGDRLSALLNLACEAPSLDIRTWVHLGFGVPIATSATAMFMLRATQLGVGDATARPSHTRAGSAQAVTFTIFLGLGIGLMVGFGVLGTFNEADSMHVMFGLFLALAGASGLFALLRLKSQPARENVMNASVRGTLVFVGLMFLLHTQHSIWDVYIHRMFALSLAAMAVAHARDPESVWVWVLGQLAGVTFVLGGPFFMSMYMFKTWPAALVLTIVSLLFAADIFLLCALAVARTYLCSSSGRIIYVPVDGTATYLERSTSAHNQDEGDSHNQLELL